MKKQKGFTLVELLVVIVIIGVLAAVLIPQITKYIEKARRSNDVQNASYMTKELGLFCIEHDIDQSKVTGMDVRTIVVNLGYNVIPSMSKWTYMYDVETKTVEVVDWSGTIYADSALVDFLEVIPGKYLLGKGTTKIEEAVTELSQGEYGKLKALTDSKFDSYKAHINANYKEGETLFINAGGVIGATDVPVTKKHVILCEGINFIPSTVTEEALGVAVDENVKLVNTFVSFACAGSESFCSLVKLEVAEIIHFEELSSNVGIFLKRENGKYTSISQDDTEIQTKLSYKLGDVTKEENPVALTSLLKESDISNIKFQLGADINEAATTTITFSEFEISPKVYVYRMSILYMGAVKPIGYFEVIYTK